jgi:hypothetical protein
MPKKPDIMLYGKSQLRGDKWFSLIIAKNQHGPEEESWEKGPFDTAEEAREAGLKALPRIQAAIASVGGRTAFKDLKRILQ